MVIYLILRITQEENFLDELTLNWYLNDVVKIKVGKNIANTLFSVHSHPALLMLEC